MNEGNNLFRMSFIIQDNAATSLESNLVKIIEAVIYESGSPSLQPEDIQRLIEEYCGLTFSLDEINRAVKRRGRNLIVTGKNISLQPSYRITLSNRGSFESELKKYAQMAVRELRMDVSLDVLCNLLTEYLYYCFNSNKDTLLSLVRNDPAPDKQKLEMGNNDIALINQFLSWNNDDKNRFIYNTISYCYVYCTLTVRKNTLLAKELFRGKKFFLDANIIFRLAGINNDARKFTITSFVKKCREVGIELCYTDYTLNEIYRVISTNVRWIERINNYQAPLDLRNYDPTGDDFYNLYCIWSKEDGNYYDDYGGFQRHLFNLITEVLNEITLVQIPNYGIVKKSDFNGYMNALSEYKLSHTYRSQSNASLKTDVNNIMHIKELRGKQNSNMWSTHEYFISADQNLIAWSQDVYPGIPLAVLPSIWLTIILRFSGRSADDYKAFCSFLKLRIHIAPDSIDVYRLVSHISDKTSNNDLKIRIVKEVFEHKSDYAIKEEKDYEAVATRAFDVIIQQMSEEERMKVEALESQLRDSGREKDQEVENARLQRAADHEQKISILINEDEKKRFRLVAWLNKVICPIGFLLAIGLFVLAVMTIFGSGPVSHLLVDILKRPELMTPGILLTGMGMCAAFIVFISRGMLEGIRYLNGSERREQFRKKRREYYKQLFGDGEDSVR